MNLINYTEQYAQQWNEFVHSLETATPYHLTFWSTAVEQAYGHRNKSQLILQSNAIEAVLPVCEFTTLKQNKVLSSLPFCDVGGALAKDSTLQEYLTDEFKINNEARDYEIRQRGAVLCPEQLEDKAGSHVKVSMIMPIAMSATELLASFKPKLRSQIKKAEKNGLTTKLVQDDSLLDDFYAVISRNMRDLGSPVHSKLFYQKIMQNYGRFAATAIVYKGDKPCAAGIVLNTQLNGCIPWASSLKEYNKLAPNMLLYWTLLAHMADSGIQSFDFGRSTINEGTYRFKKQWGAQPVALHWYSSNNKGDQDQPVTRSKARSLVENIWRKLPLATTTFIGPKIRKFISL